jgi:Protein of unknown function (DUF4242)
MPGADARATYLVECYWPGISEASLTAAAERIHKAVSELRLEGGDVEFLESILVGADETVFCLFDGTEQDVRTVSRHADLPFERVVASRCGSGGQTTQQTTR